MLSDAPSAAEEPMLVRNRSCPVRTRKGKLGLGVYSAAAAGEEVAPGLRAFGLVGAYRSWGDPLPDGTGPVGLAAYHD